VSVKTSFIKTKKAAADWYYNLNWRIPYIFNAVIKVPINVYLLIFKLQLLKFRLRNTDLIAISLVERIGDIVACEPISRYVKSVFPNCYLIWIVKKPYRELIYFNPHIDLVICLDFFSEWISLKKFDFFDQVYDLHLDGKTCEFSKVLYNPSASKLNLDNYFEGRSLLGAFSLAANLPEIEDQPRFYFSSDASFDISTELPFVTIHCTSSDNEKDWSNEKWNELVTKLTLKKILVFEIGVHRVVNVDNRYYKSYCSKLTLQQTAFLISKSAIFLGIDSGPAHIANAVGTYGIILLGKYRHFTYYNPYTGDYRNNKNATILHSDSTANISVEAVYTSIINKFRIDE
jgi:ADP-heptose:LPS heptosyltransferase